MKEPQCQAKELGLDPAGSGDTKGVKREASCQESSPCCSMEVASRRERLSCGTYLRRVAEPAWPSDDGDQSQERECGLKGTGDIWR